MRTGLRFGRFAEVLRAPAMLSGFVAALVGRLPLGMNALGILLLIRTQTGGFGRAGVIVAIFGFSAAIGVPVSGRLVDRRGVRPLWICAILGPLVLVGLTVAVHTRSEVAVVTLSVVAGALQPPLTSAFRAMCASRLGGDRLTAAYSLDGIVVEVTFLAGPPLVGAALALGAPQAALYLSAALTLIGTAWFIAVSSRDMGNTSPARRGRLWASPYVWVLSIVALLVMGAVATVEVGIIALAFQFGKPTLSGLMLTLWAAGSIIGGLVFGARRWPGSRRAQYGIAALVAALLFLPLLLADSALSLAGLTILAGFALAPTFALGSTAVGTLVFEGSRTEAFGWVSSAGALGGSVGYTVAGLAVDWFGVTAAVLLATVVTVLAAALSQLLPGPALEVGAVPLSHRVDGPATASKAR